MVQSSPLINKNITKEQTHQYLFTSMVSHRGTPVSFAMRQDGRIFYSVLDMSNTEQNANQSDDNNDQNNDKNYWSKVNFEDVGASRLHFPSEIMQVGYGVVPNFVIDKYDKTNKKIIHSYNTEGKPLDENGKELSVQAIKDKTDTFYSSTARLGAKAPFQVLSDGKYIYLFRQSIPGNDPNNENPAIVNNTLLVDRFILSGTTLKLSREIRYQRSRHKTEPESRKDTLSPVDVEGQPFYEPTRELVFANNLANGNFSVLLLPGADSEEQRWQIFTTDAVTGKVNSFNIRFDYSIVFDMSDSQTVVNEFIEKYELKDGLVSEVQGEIKDGHKDDVIANALLSKSPYNVKGIPEDALTEVVYIIRTGVVKDDFIPASMSEWPLIEDEDDKTTIKAKSTDNGVLKDSFQAPTDKIKPRSVKYYPVNGLSSCYYYQQEMGADNKPMKNKACVMLAMGLEDQEQNKYIGILNFSAAASGQLSRLTTDTVDMPDINVQALDENPYNKLEDIPTDDANRVGWQSPQKMKLLNIDTNGLSTSGGVLKFAYTSASIGISAGYSDAVVATEPYLFDDSLGRVNLYLKGKEKNFFVLYFNPTGGKSVEVSDSSSKTVDPPLSLKSRLDRDMTLNVVANVPSDSNTCTLTMTSQGSVVEEWNHLPRRFSQMTDILNGSSLLRLGTLEPLGNTDAPRAAYIKPQTGNGIFKLRTTVDNNLMFQVTNGYAAQLADGVEHPVPLSNLSDYLNSNPKLNIAKKQFSLVKTANVKVKADVFYKSYLSGMVTDTGDIDKLWGYLKSKNLIQEVAGATDRGNLKSASMTGTQASLSIAITDEEINNLSLQLLQEGNEADKKARRARLKQSLIALILDVAKVRIITFTVQDTNVQSVDRLEAGLEVMVGYDYTSLFTCNPTNLGGTSAPEWEHSRSYLFNAEVKYDADTDTKTEISDTFNYEYNINNTIGQWEDWKASLALEFNPASATNGAQLNTADSNKLEALQPTEKGLSVEAWVKASNILNNPGSILYYKKGSHNYSLGIEKDGADKYKCVATLGGKKYTSKNGFAFQSEGKEEWRHLAFTHKKYWGYQLNNENLINCGNDSSLQLIDEFTLEVLVKIDAAGTLLEKTGEYSLSINGNKEVVFNWAGTNYLSDNSITLDSFNKFYKITLIRSKNKPQTEPTKAEYPMTGGNQEVGTDSGGKKWYEGKTQEQMIKGMAEKQDQMDNSMKLSETNMFGNTADQSTEDNPKYHHTLIVTKSDNSTTEWTSATPLEIESVEAFQDFIMGGGGFTGTFASVRIWNRALSTSEAKVLTMPENKAGLLSQWRVAEGKGNYLYDDVSENHGVASGGTWIDSPQANQPGQFQFYVDGSPQPHDTTIDSTAQGVDQLSIGGIKKGASSYSDHFRGTLEEIRIWNVPRTNEQITDNGFGRLKGEWELLLANYTFDKPIKQTDNKVQDASVNSVQLTIHNNNSSMLKEVLSTAPIATEIPQVRSALTGVLTEYNGKIRSRPAVVEYGDVQKNDDGTLNGILKRCYSFIDADGAWNRMTGYKVGNLVSQWYGQAQFAPQVMGYLEGPPPVPAENFPVGKDADVDTYAYKLNNSISFNQAEEVSYNYSTSKEAGWNVAVESEATMGGKIQIMVAPLGFGFSFGAEVGFAYGSNWETSGNRSQSYERGTSVNTERTFDASLAGYDNGKSGAERYYKLGNTGYALVKSKTADIYLLRLEHNNALVTISWQPNPDIPEDVNIIPFPINPLYTKQGTLDGKFGETTDDHYPQAQGAYGQYSYFKPREAYKLKKQIDREKMELKAYFEDSFDVAKTNAHFNAAASTTGIAQLAAFYPVAGPMLTSGFNQVAGQLATQVGYNNTNLKNDLADMGSQRNLANTYVWTVEGGFYAESTEVAETQQETYSNETSLSLGGNMGVVYEIEFPAAFEQKSLFSSGSSFTLTKSKTKESSTSFGLDVSVDIPTSPRYKYAGKDGRTLSKGLIGSGTVDAYRFMSFYLEPKGKNFIDLYSKVIDPIWLDESPDPNAQALRQARGNIDKAKPCWRIMHRVTYVSRILPEFQPEAPPSLEKSMRANGIESNYMLIKKFEPYIANISDAGTFFTKIEQIIDAQLPEFAAYKQQIKNYLALYFNIDQA
ncbi:MAG: LamG domain-containing protein [Okeania sp. SIO3H1]|nr:LamG domain-containing protein [Okeania sp. SIO3H1]